MTFSQIPDPTTVSLIVTTYGTDTLYTEACLESIARWKRFAHELIVVTHDETPLLRAYLDARTADGLIDRLIYANSGHGHTRGYNLGVQYSSGDVVFNICNDIKIGPGLVDDCARQLRADKQLGMIGWHWYNEGTRWRDGKVVEFALRDQSKPDLAARELENIRRAPWYTGKLFESLGGPRWLQLCNTGFFGIRRDLLRQIGGGFRPEYAHYWADDFLNYAVLDQGLDVRHFPARYRSPEYFAEFQYENTDVADRRRHADELRGKTSIHDAIRFFNGGMSADEERYLHLLARSVPEGGTVTQVGVWRGSSAIVMMDSLAEKSVTFRFLDCFDLPGISSLSAQSPVSVDEFASYIRPHIGPRHRVLVERVNTLELDAFPVSDFILVDAGHTKECITHDAPLAMDCLTPNGVAVFHDYGQPSWPDVKPAIDAVFSGVRVYKTLAVYRRNEPSRVEYRWPEERKPQPATPAVA